MTQISRLLKWCGDTLPCPSGNRTLTVPQAQTQITKGLSHSIFFWEMQQNYAFPWLPSHKPSAFNGGHLPQKARCAANTQSFTFSMLLHWKTKQPDKIPHYTLRWGSTAHHLPQNPLLYWLSGHTCRKKIQGVIKSVCFNLTDHNSTIILISTLISTSLCVIFLWETVSVLILKTGLLPISCFPVSYLWQWNTM